MFFIKTLSNSYNIIILNVLIRVIRFIKPDLNVFNPLKTWLLVRFSIFMFSYCPMIFFSWSSFWLCFGIWPETYARICFKYQISDKTCQIWKLFYNCFCLIYFVFRVVHVLTSRVIFYRRFSPRERGLHENFDEIKDHPA